MKLPIGLPLPQMQTLWKAIIDPLLSSPTNSLSILEKVALVTGNTVINHKLDRMQQGWVITDINGAASIYRSQPFNNKTLTLNSSANVTVNIGVF